MPTLPVLNRIWRFTLIPGLLLCVGTTLLGCGPKPVADPFTGAEAEVAYARGKRFLEVGQDSLARAEFERARGLDPGYAPAYEGLSLVALAQGRIVDAIRDIRLAKLKDINYVPAWIGTGLLYASAKRYEDAIVEYQEALRRDSDRLWTKEIYYHIGQAYLGLGQIDRARESFANALVLDPLYLEAAHALAQIPAR